MITKYILKARGIFIGLIFLASFSGLTAQKQNLSVKSDSNSYSITKFEVIPGNLFNTTKINNTGSVSILTDQTLSSTSLSGISNSLYGILPGLTVKQGSGEPGFDQASLGIRGIGTYGNVGNGGFNSSVIFVDGFQVDPNYFYNLPASEIESISVLKDAASLVTFGMNGSNGIIWIVTKKAEAGIPKVSFNFQYGLGSPEKINKPLNSYEYAKLFNQAVSNDNGDVWFPYYSDSQLQDYKNGIGTNVDWYDQVLRNSAPSANGNLRFTGGDSHTRYNILFDYFNQQGLYDVKNTDNTSNEKYNRYNLGGNLAFDWGIFEAKIGINGRLEDRKAPNFISNFSTYPLWNNLATYPNNIYPIYDDSMKQHFSGTTTYPNNPVGSIKGLGWESNETRYLVANFSLKEKLNFFAKGLYLNEAFSYFSNSLSTYNKTATYARYFNGSTTTTDKTTPIVASALNANSQEDWKQAVLTLGYDNHFGKNSITSALNYYQSDYKGEGLSGFLQRYQNINGRFNFNNNDRYIGEFGFSYFGCDAYAPGHRWKFYPAISGSWIISNEAFFKSNPVVNFLKLKASFGELGGADAGDNINNSGRYLYQQYYNNGGNFFVGNTTPTQQSTITSSYIANHDIGPEKSFKYNVGAEINLLKRIDVLTDFFLDKRRDIITVNNTIPSDYGYTTEYGNIGKMTDKGFEATVSYSDKIDELSYSLIGMASYNENKIDYMSEIPTAYPYNAQTGRSYGTPIGLVATGFYQVEDFNADGTLKSDIAVPAFGTVQPGDLRYKDLNGDGKVDQTDVTAIGKSGFPKWTYSFGTNITYKGFDFKILFQGISGISVNLLGSNQTIPFVNYAAAYSIAQKAWAYYPDQGIDTRHVATFPRLTTEGNANNYRTSSFWMKDGDFLRLRNVELGYSFSSSLLKKTHIDKLRIYINSTNPVTWSSLLKNYHIDPESYNGYPALKYMSLGISANF